MDIQVRFESYCIKLKPLSNLIRFKSLNLNLIPYTIKKISNPSF